MSCHFVFHIHLPARCSSRKKKRRSLTELAAGWTPFVDTSGVGSPGVALCVVGKYFPRRLTVCSCPLCLRRLPDRAVLHPSQQPDVSGAAQRDHLHQDALLRHHRPGLGTPLRAVPRPAAPLQAGVHPQHSHRSLSRSERVTIKRSSRAG